MGYFIAGFMFLMGAFLTFLGVDHAYQWLIGGWIAAAIAVK